MATRGRFFNDYFFPDQEEDRPESSTSGGGGEIPPGFDDPLGPSPQARDRAIAAPNPYAPHPNPMLRALGLEPSPFDFLTGAAGGGTVHPGAAVQGGGPSGAPARGQGRGPGQIDIASFFGGTPGGQGELDVNEFLAGQRGRTFQDIQGWNPTTDLDYQQSPLVQAETARLARLYGANMLNPIVAANIRGRAMDNPIIQRQYQLDVLGYDPRFNRMLVPQGFDPLSDPEFLRRSAAVANERNARRQQAREQQLGPGYARRQSEAEIARIISFFGLP